MPGIRILFVLMLFSSCQLDYEDNRRVLISGQVVGFENEELPAFPIEAYASVYADTDLIGTDQSNTKGKYAITTISAKNSQNISVYINKEGTYGYQGDRPSITLQGVNFLMMEDSKYTIPNRVRMGKMKEVQVKIHRITNQMDRLEYKILYNAKMKEISFEPGAEQEGGNWPHSKSGELFLEDSFEEQTICVPEGDSIALQYKLVNDELVKKQQTIVLPYNKTENAYEFEF
ncbi:MULTISPECIES: hypothetical protein [Flavobacteriaceae]|uniref:hypothetical protein n=1 Tax=Flavobacteriaceae TaxID=49546 RepID=UPI002349A6D6|nr:hypothetical protein [Muricauda sp. SP22]MDC6362038.1 hypothetical protein [Muricauda sp. SP22]